MNMPSLLLPHRLLICFPFAWNAVHLDFCMAHFLITLLLLRKDFIYFPVFSGNPTIGNAVGPHLCLSAHPTSEVVFSFAGQFPIHGERAWLCLSAGRFSQATRVCLAMGGVGWSARVSKQQPSTNRGRVWWIQTPAFFPVSETIPRCVLHCLSRVCSGVYPQLSTW